MFGSSIEYRMVVRVEDTIVVLMDMTLVQTESVTPCRTAVHVSVEDATLRRYKVWNTCAGKLIGCKLQAPLASCALNGAQVEA